MSEIRARARRRAFCLGSCTMNGFTGRSGPLIRCPGAEPPPPPPPPPPGAAGAAGAGRGGGTTGMAGGRGAAAPPRAGAPVGAGAAEGAAGRLGGAAGGGVAGAAGGTTGRGAGGAATGPENRGIAGGRGGAGAGVGAGGAADGGGGAGARGGAAGARWAAAEGGEDAVAPPAAAFTGNTLLQTAQRARTPPGGILPGSTRYTVSHDGQVTFTLGSGYLASSSSSSGSWRRSTTNTDPGCVFAYDFISVASSLTWAGCANRRCWFVTMPMDRVINGTRWSCPRRSLPK